MITFTLCLLALIVGYFTYGRLMERIFAHRNLLAFRLERTLEEEFIIINLNLK